MEKDYYIRLISTFDLNDKYGRWLIALMDKYNKYCLRDITLNEAKEFWNYLVKEKRQPWQYIKF